MTWATGWFGMPGDLAGNRSTKVHFVKRGAIPICGARFAVGMEFQWCANGPQFHMLECKSCERVAKATFKRPI